MRPARRASPPRHPDPPVNPRSTLPYPTCGRLQKPPTGYQSLTRPATGISRPPIASYLPPHLGSKMTKARTARLLDVAIDAKPVALDHVALLAGRRHHHDRHRSRARVGLDCLQHF